MTKEKGEIITIDEFARMVNRSFDNLEMKVDKVSASMATKVEVNERFDGIENRLDRIESKIDINQENRLSKIEDEIRIIKTKLEK